MSEKYDAHEASSSGSQANDGRMNEQYLKDMTTAEIENRLSEMESAGVLPLFMVRLYRDILKSGSLGLPDLLHFLNYLDTTWRLKAIIRLLKPLECFVEGGRRCR